MELKKIPLSFAKENMILANDVTNTQGQVLTPKGTKLTFNEISWFESIGIENISIEYISENNLLQSKYSEDTTIINLMNRYRVTDIDKLNQKILEDINEQFNSPKSPLMIKVRDECITYFLERIGLS